VELLGTFEQFKESKKLHEKAKLQQPMSGASALVP